jgi:hypothetical protein
MRHEASLDSHGGPGDVGEPPWDVLQVLDDSDPAEIFDSCPLAEDRDLRRDAMHPDDQERFGIEDWSVGRWMTVVHSRCGGDTIVAKPMPRCLDRPASLRSMNSVTHNWRMTAEV